MKVVSPSKFLSPGAGNLELIAASVFISVSEPLSSPIVTGTGAGQTLL